MITSFATFNESLNNNKTDWSQNTIEVVIPQFKRASFDKLFKKLIRFSKTLQFPKPTMVEKGVKIEYNIVFRSMGGGFYGRGTTTESKEEVQKLIKGISPNQYELTIRRYDIIDLTIVNEVKPMDEWEILGTINYKDGLVNPAPGKEVPMELLKDINLSGSSFCAHCNKTLKRNKTVFVKNTENGEIKQIGGTCTKYYLGLDYQKILTYLESLHELSGTQEFDEDEWGSYGGSVSPTVYSVDSIIKYYVGLVKKTNTHTSKKSAAAYNEKVEDGRYKQSTGETVVSNYVSANSPIDERGMKSNEISYAREQQEKLQKEIKMYSDFATKEDVQEIYDFIESKKGESNFMFNVSNKVSEGFLEEDMLRFVTGACSFFFGVKFAQKAKEQRDNERKDANAEKAANSKHIGVVGEKVGFSNLEIKGIKGFETQFGYSNVYNMEDETGNVFTKFGTINSKFLVEGDKVEVGSKLSFTGDIKDHTEFNGIPQTIIGRLSKYNPKLQY